MKNPRKTILYLFLIFHLLNFIGALYIDARQDDLGFLLSMKGYLPWMKYFAMTGLVLFLVAYIVVLRDTRLLRKTVEQSKEDHTLLKAKLFDLQEASKNTNTSFSSATTEEPSKTTLDITDEKEEKEESGESEEEQTSP